VVSRCVLILYAATHVCSVFVFLTQIRENRCESYQKRRPRVLSNTSTQCRGKAAPYPPVGDPTMYIVLVS